MGTHFRTDRLFLAIVMLSILSGCGITRHVPDERYLLDKVVVQTDGKGVKPDELMDYVKQKPNKRILGFRFHLRLYSMSSPYKYKGINRWLKLIGEAPVLYDSNLVRKSVQNISSYLQSKGYYNAIVTDSVAFSKKRVQIYYFAKPNRPYTIRRIRYYIEDSLIRSYVMADTINRTIHPGNYFDTDELQKERTRIETLLRNNGYFKFSKELITFTADTNRLNGKVDLTLVLRNPVTFDSDGNKVKGNFSQSVIKRVFLYPGYDPLRFSEMRKNGQLDTVNYKGVEFIFHNDPEVSISLLYSYLQIRPGMRYSQEMIRKTRKNLSSIKLYKFVNISFKMLPREKAVPDKPVLFAEENVADSLARYNQLNCYIRLSPHTLQSYQVELVGTNTTGSLGAEGNLNYQHKNLFKGAEVFDVKFRGLIESAQQNINFNNTLELGGSMGLSIPKFIGPFSSRFPVSKNFPTTQITASYSYQRRPDYMRNIASLKFGYSWRTSAFLTQSINPVEINAITIGRISEEFQNEIENSFLKYSYVNQIITVSSYSFTYNNQNIQRLSSYTYVRYNLELSGNILRLAYGLLEQPKNADGTYKILNTSFSQFVRSDINLTYHQVIDRNNTFVYRLFVGCGYPYGNSRALPFEKRYFTGGANGIRAWQARALGPGSYYQEDEKFPNRTADIKLEANFEYRFRMFWKLEGALFLDAGNIWSLPGIDDREGAAFGLNTFYKQIALGSGLGFRVNMGFFTMRVDFGYKVYDPAINPNKPFRPWVPFQQKFMLSDFTFNFGIGYPF